MSATEVSTEEGGARRALVLHDRQLVVDLIELTLNHGIFVVRAATDLAGAEEIIANERPHLASHRAVRLPGPHSDAYGASAARFMPSASRFM